MPAILAVFVLSGGAGGPRFFLPPSPTAGPARGGPDGAREEPRSRALAAPIEEVDRDLEGRVEALGMELVDLEWSGTQIRPIIRVRIDRPDSAPGAGVTVADCGRVSRELERWLDEHPALPERYVLEVSSPGVERPLRRRRDYERFVGREVRIKRSGSGGRGGVLIGVLCGVDKGGVDDGSEGYRVVLRLSDGSTVGMEDREIVRANLVFRWEEER
ncbi:MAG: ribosome maturation factor RimP [Gemmatimonadetes bacterium]|nr:ribosome maturation factor RimP [Gemmatimonadota bacterium]